MNAQEKLDLLVSRLLATKTFDSQGHYGELVEQDSDGVPDYLVFPGDWMWTDDIEDILDELNLHPRNQNRT